MRFLVRILHYGGNYSAMVPDLPGCIAAADTVEETRELIAEAIGLHLDMMRKSGEKIPVPRQSTRFGIDDSSQEELCTWVEVKAPKPPRGRRTVEQGQQRRGKRASA